MDPPALEHLDVPVVHPHRERRPREAARVCAAAMCTLGSRPASAAASSIRSSTASHGSNSAIVRVAGRPPPAPPRRPTPRSSRSPRRLRFRSSAVGRPVRPGVPARSPAVSAGVGSSSSSDFTCATSGDMARLRTPANMTREAEHLQGHAATARLDRVAEEADADGHRGQGVHDDQRRLRRGDGPGVEGVLGQEEARSPRPRPPHRATSGPGTPSPSVADLGGHLLDERGREGEVDGGRHAEHGRLPCGRANPGEEDRRPSPPRCRRRMTRPQSVGAGGRSRRRGRRSRGRVASPPAAQKRPHPLAPGHAAGGTRSTRWPPGRAAPGSGWAGPR